ncbi:hypothetical protein TNCV_3822031 [Trichonephila clavipes]|nr:hypothetical protein TNCV_3822031 [Trichonephila clavipes]
MFSREVGGSGREMKGLPPPPGPYPSKLEWNRTKSYNTYLAVGKYWSRLLNNQRCAQLSALPRVEGVACFRVITEHDYLQAYLFKLIWLIHCSVVSVNPGQ